MARQYAEKEGKPVILFVDEVDSLLGSRNSEVGGEVRTKNQFLTEMDGVNGKGKNLMLYVIGATNKPWSLDWPFLRRFQKRIYISLPTNEARKMLFEQYTAPLNKNIDVRPADLAKLFDGYSASDIKDVCQSAQIKTVHEIFNATPTTTSPQRGEEPVQPRALTTSDFRAIMGRRKPSVSVRDDPRLPQVGARSSRRFRRTGGVHHACDARIEWIFCTCSRCLRKFSNLGTNLACLANILFF